MKTKKTLLYVVISCLLGFIVIAGILVKNANRILRHELDKFLGEGFSVESIELHWGSVEVRNLSIIRPDKRITFKSSGLLVKADFIGLLKKENVISELALESPYILLEVDRSGKMIFPIPKKEGGRDRKEKSDKKPSSFLVKTLEVKKGSIDYLDRKVSNVPALIKLRDIQLDVKNIAIPQDNVFSDYSITANIPGKMGTGVLKGNGRINLRTKDTKSKLSIKNLDLTEMRPYFQKKGDVEVTRGFLSVDTNINISSSKIKAPGKMVIRDLEFRTGSGNRFLGLPLLAVIKLLKDSNNEISLDFTIEGDLDNPKFNIRDSIIQKMTLSLAKTLGMPIETIGRSVFEFGGEALKKIFK